jgi:hypothetical protein
MAPLEVIETADRVPLGSHALAVYATPEEATHLLAAFASGAPRGQPTRLFVSDEEQARAQRLAIGAGPTEHLKVLPEGQAVLSEGRLRPAPAVRDFVEAHGEGVTAAGDTVSRHLTSSNARLFMEYEHWFDRQPRTRSRFLCPYDLRLLPTDQAPSILRSLAQHHSYVVLSGCRDPDIQLLQLFLFERQVPPPAPLASSLSWALAEKLVVRYPLTDRLGLTPDGQRIVRAGSRAQRGAAGAGPN